MSNTIRIFLGTRLECAQCLDHPFDKWTQRQYFEMVAFTGGLQVPRKRDAQPKRTKLESRTDLRTFPPIRDLFSIDWDKRLVTGLQALEPV